VSGRAMLETLVAGERDPQVLAELAKGRLRAKLPQLRQALRGRFGAHHALLIRLALAHLEQLEASIAELDTHIDRVLVPFAQARDRLDTITGVGKRAAEACSPRSGWRCRCSRPPGTWPGGRAAARATTAPAANAARASRPRATAGWGRCSPGCAWAAARSRDTYLSAQYWRLARRIGKQEGRGRGGALDPGDRLVPAHRQLHLSGRVVTTSSGATPIASVNGPSPSSKPSATRSPSNPSLPNTRGFTFQDKVRSQTSVDWCGYRKPSRVSARDLQVLQWC
jgi:hypothetical protein